LFRGERSDDPAQLRQPDLVAVEADFLLEIGLPAVGIELEFDAGAGQGERTFPFAVKGCFDYF